MQSLAFKITSAFNDLWFPPMNSYGVYVGPVGMYSDASPSYQARGDFYGIFQIELQPPSGVSPLIPCVVL
jgi:hypothetical protein